MPLCPPQAVYPGLYGRVRSAGFQRAGSSGRLGSDVGYQPDSHNHAGAEGFGAQTRSWKKRCTEVCFLFNTGFLTMSSRGFSSWKKAMLGSSTDTQKWVIFLSVFSWKSPICSGLSWPNRQLCKNKTHETLKDSQRVLVFHFMKNIFNSFVIISFTFYYPLPTNTFAFI